MGASETSRGREPRESGAKVKGTLIVTLKKVLRAKGIDPEVVIVRLPPPDREVLRGILLPSGWYAADMFARFVEDAAAVASSGGVKDCLLEMGRFSAQTNLGPGGLRRAYIRQGDPHHVLAAISRIYATVYSLGTRTYERAGECSAIIRGHGTRFAHDHCTWVSGWLQGVVELSGGKEVRVIEVQCEGSHAPHCEYRVDWK